VNITKTTQSLKATREELEQINSMTRRELEEENLYLFSVRLCDNEVDRDGERFTTETLQELAPMFVGKSGIFDHQWSAHGQSARLYKCEVVTEPARLNQAGEVYCWLKGYAYMLRSEHTKALIDEIEEKVAKNCGVKPISIEGRANLSWVLMDYGSVVVHVFLPETRDYYRLERLWGEAPRVELDLQ
jgi:sulfatase maturation enzyme AslB (radical SAM superfamily)